MASSRSRRFSVDEALGCEGVREQSSKCSLARRNVTLPPEGLEGLRADMRGGGDARLASVDSPHDKVKMNDGNWSIVSHFPSVPVPELVKRSHANQLRCLADPALDVPIDSVSVCSCSLCEEALAVETAIVH